jgi:hypothetical protein
MLLQRRLKAKGKKNYDDPMGPFPIAIHSFFPFLKLYGNVGILMALLVVSRKIVEFRIVVLSHWTALVCNNNAQLSCVRAKFEQTKVSLAIE